MPLKGSKRADPARIARERFGFEKLKSGQEKAIRSILDGRDTLLVMPTGAGKSAVYQLAGLLISGPTLIVSPLIALQRDQVGSIEEQQVAPAAVVNSIIRTSERREAFEELEEGELEFLFMAPEQFNNEETIARLRAVRPSLFVADEAHCISEWGHDFRPDYLKLGAVIEVLGHPAVLALTATASADVREEIVQRLGMRDPLTIVEGFDRPNIWLGVETFPNEAAKREAILSHVEQAEKPGIVYVSSRRHAEEIAGELSDRGVKAVFYHGGMKAAERGPIQDEFMSGDAAVIVATSAFGMGVDKPNVRFVFHADISDSLDSYYQEIGRAGRDGQEARAILFYRPEDLNIHRFFKGGGKLNPEQIEMVARAVHEQESPIDPEELRDKLDLSKTKLARAIHRLEEAGVIEIQATGEVAPAQTGKDLRQAAEEASDEQQRRREHELLKLEKMKAYAELLDCRREYLLNYFGERRDERCGFCDNCQSPKSDRKEQPERAAQPFPVKTRVLHKEWGKGMVESYDGDKINVLFDDAGKKILSLRAVLNGKLLERA